MTAPALEPRTGMRRRRDWRDPWSAVVSFPKIVEAAKAQGYEVSRRTITAAMGLTSDSVFDVWRDKGSMPLTAFKAFLTLWPKVTMDAVPIRPGKGYPTEQMVEAALHYDREHRDRVWATEDGDSGYKFPGALKLDTPGIDMQVCLHGIPLRGNGQHHITPAKPEPDFAAARAEIAPPPPPTPGKISNPAKAFPPRPQLVRDDALDPAPAAEVPLTPPLPTMLAMPAAPNDMMAMFVGMVVPLVQTVVGEAVKRVQVVPADIREADVLVRLVQSMMAQRDAEVAKRLDAERRVLEVEAQWKAQVAEGEGQLAARDREIDSLREQLRTAEQMLDEVLASSGGTRDTTGAIAPVPANHMKPDDAPVAAKLMVDYPTLGEAVRSLTPKQPARRA